MREDSTNNQDNPAKETPIDFNRFKVVFDNLSNQTLEHITAIRITANALSKLYEMIPGREMSFALTNLEQSAMWVIKAVCLWDEKIKEESATC